MSDIQVRLATIADTDALVGMQVEFEEFFINLGAAAPYEIDADARRRDIIEFNFAAGHIGRTIVAEMDGEIVGRISFYRGYLAEVPPVWIFRLAGVFVRAPYRHMGVTRCMFDELINIARRENVKEILWSVWEPNTPAVAFYEKIGAKYCDADQERYMYLEI